MRKAMGILLAAALGMSLAGCRSAQQTARSGQNGFDYGEEILVVSREDGSGTRGAFIELFGIEQKNEAGEKVDRTTDEAMITNNTAVMMTSVANEEYAIGYCSLGSLNSTVKALEIDGVTPSVETVNSGSYQIARPFNLVVKRDSLSDLADDFINFILSAEGQAVIEENKYIPIDDGGSFVSNGAAGSLSVAGSSSVTPVMEKLAEAYMLINASAGITVQQNDSTTGVNSVIDGVCELGMASRALKDSEIEKGVESIAIANDGIAVIVSNDNPIGGLTKEQVRDVYTGAELTWDFAE